MVGLFIQEVLFEHVDLVVSKHAFFSHFAEGLYLRSEGLIFINFFHESCVLLLFGGVNAFGPTLNH